MSADLESIAAKAQVMASRVWQIGTYNNLPYRLTGERLMVLYTIRQSEPISTAGVAEIERVASPTISRQVGEMEADGLIARIRNPNDARGHFLQLTKKGHTAYDKATRIACGPIHERLELLSIQERKIVEEAIQLLMHLCTTQPDGGRVLSERDD